MKFTTQVAALAAVAAAAPLEKRAAGPSDADILNFALTLEHLEATFYKQGLEMFDQAAFDAVGAVPRLRFNIEETARQEATHVSVLTSALQAAGATPVQQCTYNFGLTDVESFLTTSSILEGVGVSAYLGAAAFISSKEHLTVAGSILTVEARHDAYIRDNQMAPGPQSPYPTPFDVPLGLNQVYSLAAPFIVSCPPENPPLPVMAFPTLSLAKSNPAYLRSGYPVALETEKALTGTVFCAFPAIAAGADGAFFEEATVSGTSVTCQVPEGVPGESFVVLTSSKSIADASTLAGPAILQVQAPYTYPGFPK